MIQQIKGFHTIRSKSWLFMESMVGGLIQWLEFKAKTIIITTQLCGLYNVTRVHTHFPIALRELKRFEIVANNISLEHKLGMEVGRVKLGIKARKQRFGV